MNQRKPNMTRWYAMGLTALLVVGCLVMAVGVTWARYRTDVMGSTVFQSRKPLAVRLGKMEPMEDGTTLFVPGARQTWERVDGKLRLDFAVANGTSAEVFETRDQRFHIRLVGSIGAWSGDETAAIYLEIPPRAETETEPTLVKATAARIEPGTQLWSTFGDGWTFRFLDPRTGRELDWTLEGGGLTCLDLDLVMEGSTLTDTSLLQMQIIRVSDGK